MSDPTYKDVEPIGAFARVSMFFVLFLLSDIECGYFCGVLL